MRTGLLAILIAGAAFAGGFLVNGPGLGWARAALRWPGTKDDFDVLPSGNLAGVPARPVAPSATVEPPPSSINHDPSEASEPSSSPTPQSSALSTEVKRSALKEEPRAEEILAASPKILPFEASDAPGPPPAPRDADVVPAAPGPAPEADPPAAKPDPSWADLQRRMRELGVSRYWIEGEIDGRTRFRCVIPLAGRSAVGQQFEAEGDDAPRAAEAALRRIALWRASEGS
jgi:hypothetical protein